MNKTSVIVICILFTMVSLIPTINSDEPVFATTLYVGGSGPGNYTTIQSAINDASSGDTVFVYNGTYYENVVVNKTLDLIGEKRNSTVIDANDNSDVIIVNANNVSIEGFTIQNAGYHANGILTYSSGNTFMGNNILDNSNVGIWLDKESCINTISHNIFSGNVFGFISLESCSDNIISNNIFTENNNGLELEWSSNTIISNNLFYENVNNEAYIYQSSNIDINGNTFENNQHIGLYIYNTLNLNISDNIFLSNGIYVYGENVSNWNSHIIQNNTINDKPLYYFKNFNESFSVPTDAGQVICANCENMLIQNLNINETTCGILIGFSDNSTISNNFINNTGTGILIEGSYNNKFFNNEITENGRGFNIFFSSYNTIFENIINDNYFGFIITHLNWMIPPENNSIYHNNFINNYERQAFDSSSNFWDNSYPSGGNYWSGYNGIDDDGDGIGDTPYNISGGSNQDLYPLMFPRENPPFFVWVDDGFNSSTPGWQYDHFDVIQDGIDAVAENRTVYVYNGTYYENIDINKTIELTGEQRNTTVIQGILDDAIIEILSDDVTLNNFTIKSNWEGEPSGGIIVESDYNIIKDNIIEIPYTCISLYSSSNNNIIIRNNILNTSHGIVLISSSNNTILENRITNTNTAIHLEMSSNNNTINNNNLSLNNFNGVFLHTNCNENKIRGNIIFNNVWEGIEIFVSQNNIVTDNEIISNGGTGIMISMSTSINNLIYHNNFINNSVNANAIGQNLWDNGSISGGNYWDDYTGIDSDGDGIGDTPYNTSGDNNQDLYPLIEENGWLKDIDVDQDVFARGFPIRHAVDGDWAAAQNFSSMYDPLTRVDVYLRRFGTPEFNLTIELREDHPQGTLLDSMVFSPEDVPGDWTWLNLDLEDMIILPGNDYFIVIPPAPVGITSNFGYEWGYAFGDQYPDGAFWFTRDGGGLWRDLPTMYEFCFRTYGYS